MDFYRLVERLKPDLKKLVVILNDPAISPELRKATLSAAFKQIGTAIYGKAYEMSAWDYEIMETVGKGIDPVLSLGLARNISDSIAVGNQQITLDQAQSYTVQAAAAGMAAASITAGQLGKYRTLRIRLRGKGDCDWCRAKAARGTIVNPTDDDFRRHGGCDCFYDAQGYKSRNGEVKNYRPT